MKIRKMNIESKESKDTGNKNLSSYNIIESDKSIKGKIISKFCNKYKKKRIYNIIAVFYNLLSFLFYYLSLEGCFDTQTNCIPLLSTMFLGRILIFGILFSLMMSIELYLIINKIIYIFHILYIIIFFIIIYRYDHGSKLDYHGLYNFVISILLIIIFSIIIGIINLIIYIKRKKNKTYQAILLIIFILIIIRIMIFSYSIRNNCKNWDQGLNSTVLDNSIEYDCEIIYPKKCLIYTLNDYFDISFYLHKTCKQDANQEQEHKKFISYLKLDKDFLSKSDLTHLGYPLTVNNALFQKKDFYNVYDFIYKNTIPMDIYNTSDNKAIYPHPEVEIFYDRKTKIRSAKINIRKNETLSKIRNEIANNLSDDNKSLFNNVLLLYIDCTSRQHFLRKMKKTSKFIEKFMKYNNNLGFNSYQFMKYQAFAHWTTPNIIPMFYSSRNRRGSKHNIVSFFKEQGYVTGSSGNLCTKEPCELCEKDYVDNNLDYDDYDHENIGMFCDPNYSSEDSPYPIFSGPYGILRKCLYGKDTFKYLLEYGKQFWETYLDNKKFLRLMFQDGHEFTGQVVKYIDEYLYDFMEDLYQKNELNDTAIFFLSDHGNSYFNYVYYFIFKSDDSLIERAYAALFIILPNNKKNNNNISEEYHNNIYENQQILISPYDIHNTLIHIALGNKSLNNFEVHSIHGRSLLSLFDGKSRNCNTWKNIVEGECLCKAKKN